MPDNDFRPKSSLVQPIYHSIEEMNEVLHASGWDGEFHQLNKGRVTSRWQSLHLGQSSLSSHHLDKHIFTRQVPPRGCVAFGIVPSPHVLCVDGADVGNDEAILLRADSEADFIVPGESRCDTLTVPQSVFEESARVLFPGMRINGQPVRVFHCAPAGWSALGREMTSLLRDGQMLPEDVSKLLTGYLNLMAGGPKTLPREKFLDNGSARRVARRAQEYIEEHYPGTIRLEDLCNCSGVSLRTLQRSFTAYFQTSPSEYIRARRLSAARQDLLAAAYPDQSVTCVAFASGFTHLGRFSVDYREHFGESPRMTLAKRAPPLPTDQQARPMGTFHQAV